MLAKHRLTAGALVRNDNNDILLVKHPQRGWNCLAVMLKKENRSPMR